MDPIIEKLNEIGFIGIRLIKSTKSRKMTSVKVIPADPKPYVKCLQFTCPVCDMPFENWTAQITKLKIEGTDITLRPFYIPLDPLYYDTIICPYCGYGAMSSYFHNFSKNKKEAIKQNVTPNFIYVNYPIKYTIEMAIERYLIALLSTLMKGSRASERAYLCLKLSWLNRDKGDLNQEALFCEYALAGFMIAYQRETLPISGMDLPTFLYLLGALSRKTGDLDNARKYISAVLSMRNIPADLLQKAHTIRDKIWEDNEKINSLSAFKKVVQSELDKP